MTSRKTLLRSGTRATAVPRGGQASETRQKLLDAAVALFLERGYDNLRIGDITEAAGVGKGTFYLHFADKRDLLLAYFQQSRERVEAVETEAEASDMEYLTRVKHRLRAALASDGQWHKVMTFLRIAAGSDDPEVAAGARSVHMRMSLPARRDMEEAIQSGLVRDIDPDLATLAFAGVAEMLAWRIAQDDTYDGATVCDFVDDLFRHAVLRDPERASDTEAERDAGTTT